MDDQTFCKICLCPLNLFPSKALLCGHTFHTDCINAYVRMEGCEKEHPCYFKCKRKASTVDTMVHENSLVTAANEAAMRSEQAMVDTSTSTIHDDEYIEENGTDVF